MRRFTGSHLLILLFLAGLGLSGCGGGHSLTTQNPAATVTIAPTNASLDFGGTMQFTVTEKDSEGHNVFHTPTWSSSNPNIQISNNGLVCAGTWNALTSPVVCTPTGTAATTQITASASGVTSN